MTQLGRGGCIAAIETMFDWRIGRGAAGALLDHPISSSREGDYPSAAKAASIRASIGVGPN